MDNLSKSFCQSLAKYLTIGQININSHNIVWSIRPKLPNTDIVIKNTEYNTLSVTYREDLIKTHQEKEFEAIKKQQYMRVNKTKLAYYIETSNKYQFLENQCDTHYDSTDDLCNPEMAVEKYIITRRKQLMVQESGSLDSFLNKLIKENKQIIRRELESKGNRAFSIQFNPPVRNELVLPKVIETSSQECQAEFKLETQNKEVQVNRLPKLGLNSDQFKKGLISKISKVVDYLFTNKPDKLSEVTNKIAILSKMIHDLKNFDEILDFITIRILKYIGAINILE